MEPSFELLSWVDVENYGFERVADPSVPEEERERLAALQKEWSGSYEQIRQRQERAWAQFELPTLQASPSVLMPKKKLLRRGLPPQLRAGFWYFASGAQKLEEEQKKGYFEELLSGSAEEHEDVEKIEKDLDRTFPNHPLYRSDQGKRDLRSCLLAFSIHNHHIGYAQSINFIGALLNLYFPPEKSFWILTALTERILPPKFYDQSLFGCRVETMVLEMLLKKKLNNVIRHIQSFDIDISVTCVGWFLCLFLNTLPIETTMRVWDALFLEGSKVIHRVAIAIFKIHASQLLACRESHEIYKTLTQMGRDLYDPDAVLHIAFHQLGRLQRSQIAKLRAQATATIQHRDAELQQRRERHRQAKSSSPPQKADDIDPN